MRNALVGNTGFVGSNLMATMKFDAWANSQNVESLYGMEPEMLIYAGVRGTKFVANANPEEDFMNIELAKKNITRIKPRRLLLISTVDVYDDLDGKDETHIINPQKLHCYGKNRYMLEEWARSNIEHCQIIRLPAIYGINLKKNFVHDLIDPVPKYLTEERLGQVCESRDISKYYELKNGLYELKHSNIELYDFFINTPYCAVFFTDSRAEYQYLDLRILHKIIDIVVESDIDILNCVTEPINSGELYYEVCGNKFENGICQEPVRYNLKTCKKAELFGGTNGWLMNRSQELSLLKTYIYEEREKLKKLLMKG